MKTKNSIQVAINFNGGETLYDEGDEIELTIKEAWNVACTDHYMWGIELTPAYDCLQSTWGYRRRDIMKEEWKDQWGKYREYYNYQEQYYDKSEPGYNVDPKSLGGDGLAMIYGIEQ